MNKKITAVFFTAVLSINIGLISQAEEQPVIYDEACSSGSALAVCLDDLSPADEPESGFEELSEEETPETVTDITNITLNKEDDLASVKIFSAEKKSEKPLPEDNEEDNEEAFEEESSDPEAFEPSAIDPHPGYSLAPNSGSAEDNNNLCSESGNIGSEEERPRLEGDSENITKPAQQAQPDGTPALSLPNRSSGGSGSGSAGKKYSEASVSEKPEPYASENIAAEDNSPKYEIYSGEELTEKADIQSGTITFDKNRTGLEIPIDFIENNSIEKDDIIPVSINRYANTVDVNVSINDEDVEEIEGAKIIVPDNNGKINILPADSLGEYYISGSYNKALWPLGYAFPFVIALAYIFLMGGAAAAVWKKIRSM